MAVIAWCEDGWLLDHKLSWMKSYSSSETLCSKGQNQIRDKLADDSTSAVLATYALISQPGICRENNGPVSSKPENQTRYIPKRELFSIFHPYLMDSEFENYAAEVRLSAITSSSTKTGIANDTEQTGSRKKRKRKRKLKDADHYLTDKNLRKIPEFISQALNSLVRLGSLTGHFSELSTLPINNNTEARRLAKQDSSDMAMWVGDVQGPTEHKQSATGGQSYSYPELCHRLCKHDGHTHIVISCASDQYIVPPCCAFSLSQAHNISAFVTALGGEKFDMIVMDPPWENKSVKRKKMYHTLASWDLRDLPIPDLAQEGCLVAVWVTNKHKHQEYVRRVLFPQWSVTHLADWVWVKVTLAGEPITGLTSQGKKPYESLILGRYRSRDLDEELTDVYQLATPLQNKVIISVPCILHSKKPPLDELLKDYCKPNPHCVELFARNLRPGWISWGNEVLRHQHLKFYDVRTSRPSCDGADARDSPTGEH